MTERASDQPASGEAQPDFGDLFRSAPSPFLILATDSPRFTIIEVNDAYLAATMRTREDLVGRALFDAFPDNPDDPTIAGVSTLHASLDRVLATREPDGLPGLKYDLARPDGSFEERWWSPINSPVLNDRGEVTAIIHNANDVTNERRADAELREAKRRNEKLATERDAILRQLTEGVIVTDAQGRITFVNRCAETLHGVAKLDVAPDEYSQSYHLFTETGDPHPPEELPLARAVLRGETVIDARWRIRRSDGSEILAIGSAHPLEVDGEPAGAVLTLRDDTDRHEAEVALRESEARLSFLDRLFAETASLADADAILATTTRLLGEHLSLSVCAYADMDEDEDGFTIRGDWAAPGSTSIVGHYSLADFGKLAVKNLGAGLPLIINDNLSELPPDEAAAFQNIGIAATICMPLVKQGRLAALMAIHDRVPRLWTEAELHLLREVTARSWAHVERVAAVAELRASEERLRLATENAEVGFWDVDLINDALIWPPRTKAMFGISADVPVSMADFYSGLHPDDREATSDAFAAAASQTLRALYDVEYRTIGKEDGLIRWVAAKGRGVFDDSGRCVRVAGTAIDITERKATEAALAESESRYRVLFEAIDSGFCEVEVDLDAFDGQVDYRVIEANPAFYRQTGFPDGIFGQWLREAAPELEEEWFEIYGRVARTGEPERFEQGSGHLGRWFDVYAFRVGEAEECRVAILFNDISARRNAEERLRELNETLEGRVTERTAELEAAHEQLRQSQKMEAMGQLTGGVAHDFNNLLTPIVGSLDMLQRKGLGGEREQRLIAGALQSADRAKTLVQRLLAFARRQPLQSTAVDVGKLMSEMADLLASTTGPQIRVVVEGADGLPLAQADQNQLEMALLNLGVNARDAMPDGGTLRISADADQLRAGHRSRLPAGAYVRLSVADTGVGMDEAVAARAIEPFFSTKGIGKGTGLGLSMVHGLVSQLGGAMTIESRPGLGTNVELWLPQATDEPRTATPREGDVPVNSGRGRALLVDDEELVRASTADMLAELGYSVVEAGSAEEAVQLFDDGFIPDLLVTDHLMPGMNGVDLARILLGRRPDLPVLVISGYAELDDLSADLPRLTKPFRSADLAASLASLGSLVAKRDATPEPSRAING